MVFSFFGSFAYHFQVKLSTHGSNLNSIFLIVVSLNFVFVNKGLDSKLQHCGPCKISWKKSKTSHLDHNNHIEGDIMQNHDQEKKMKKVKSQDSMGKTTSFLAPCLSALGHF
jgi:hypothetical protein